MRSLLLLSIPTLVGCIEEIDDSNPILDLAAVPEFTLTDYASEQPVSPADAQGHAAAYYFGHAT